MAGPSTPTPSTGGSGAIDVKPSDLWSVSGRVAAQQDFLVRSANELSKQPVDPNDPLSGYKQGGINAKAYDVTGIDTRIRYDSSRTPPFTVMTSMPSKS
ncbi:hypothetical protein [Streptomyces venezuelae]|uniref:hypothetical protein n=1 Tax=Streptomyces venezuelae TaxID=54571 RepID=UPI00363741DE